MSKKVHRDHSRDVGHIGVRQEANKARFDSIDGAEADDRSSRIVLHFFVGDAKLSLSLTVENAQQLEDGLGKVLRHLKGPEGN